MVPGFEYYFKPLEFILKIPPLAPILALNPDGLEKYMLNTEMSKVG